MESPRPSPRTRLHSPRSKQSTPARYSIEIEHALLKLSLHDNELEKLHVATRKAHIESLDFKEITQARIHNETINAISLEREKLSDESDDILRQHIEAEQRERHRREQEAILQRQREEEQARREEQTRLAEIRRLKVAEESRKAAEDERKRQEQLKAEATARAEAKALEDEKQRKEDEAQQRQNEAQRKQDEANARLAAAKVQPVVDSKPRSDGAIFGDMHSHEQVHRSYLDMYFSIKKFKNDFAEEVKKYDKPVKAPVGEGRRTIRESLGKLSANDKVVNKQATDKIRVIIKEGLQNSTSVGRRIAANQFLPPHLRLNDNDQQHVPVIVAYFLAVMTQNAINLFMNYCHGAPERADPIGIAISAIFAMPELQFERIDADGKKHNQSLFPIFLARYHKACPAIFGITADQSTLEGKAKLGWQRVSMSDGPKNTFVAEQTHTDRMTGLAIGFASFALRNFSNSKMLNPFPPKYYWENLARICNIPPEQVQPTHLLVLRHMWGHNGIERFLLFYGNIGIALMREALVYFPRRLPAKMQNDTYARELAIFVEKTLAEEMHFHLEW